MSVPPPPMPYPGPGPLIDPTTQPYHVSHLGTEHGPYAHHQLRAFAAAGQLRAETTVRVGDGGQYVLARDIPGVFSTKEFVTAVVLTWLLGSLGIDRFYLGYTGLGVLKLLTCGGFGIWALIDAILVTLRKVPDAQGRPLR